MKLCGLQKTTLLDYPGKVAATIFTGGCNFRCPFCHNSELLEGNIPAQYTDEEVLDFLNKRKNILEGVCITGGEPTLQPDLENFIRKIRALGLSVKLDTNGCYPEVLKHLCEKGLLDFVAMDIKAGRSRYGNAVGISSPDINRIDESIAFLLHGSIPFEFRTTVVKGIHTEEDFTEIGPWLQGCENYYLQCFKESGQVLIPGTFDAFSKEEMLHFADIVRPYVKNVFLRGMDL